MGLANSNQAIFIHSLWRAGSTYVFNCFRRSAAGYWAYQEPVHEIALIAKDNPDVLAEFTSETLAPLRHPKLENPYFYELQQTHSAWKDAIEKRIVYDDYFDAAPIEPLQYYLQALISASRGRPVIQECRTSGRIRAIKQAIGGTHIYLWRNPWDQWWSFKLNDYFDAACQIILGAECAPRIIELLRKEIQYQPFHHEDIGEELRHFKQHPLTVEHSYLVFYALWCLGLIEGVAHADMLLNIDMLSQSDNYRHEISNQFSSLGIQGIDFTDCNVSRAFFDATDQEFFARLESHAQGLLLATGAPQKLVDRIRLLQQQQAPSRTDTAIDPTRDLHRMREIALRAYTTDANRARQLQQTIHQTKAEKTELSQQHLTLLQEMQRHHTEEVQIAAERIRQMDLNVLQSQADSATREQLHAENVATLQAELSILLRTQVQREQDFNSQLHAILQQAAADKTELSQQHHTQLQKIQRQHAEREWLTGERIHTLNAELHQLHTNQATREQAHADNVDALQKELTALLRQQAQREREIAAQLLAIQQRSETEKAELNQRHHHSQLQHFQQQQATELVQQKLNSELLAQQEANILALAEVSALEQQLTALRLWEQQLHTSLAQQAGHAEKLAQRITDIQNTWLWRLYALFRPARWSNITAANEIDLINFSPAPLMQGNDTADNDPQAITTQHCINEGIPSTPPAMPLQPTREFSAMLPPQHIYELFILDEREFINAAYHILLGREPDPSGMNYYLGRLRMGYGKAAIIVQLANSSEVRPHNNNIKGLRKLIKEEQQANHWFWGLFTTRQRTERLMQRNGEELGRVMGGVTQLKTAIQTLPTVIDAHAQRIQASLKQLALQTTDEIANHTTIDNSTAPEHPPESERLKQLTPRARNIHLQLKKTVAHQPGSAA